MLVKCEKFLFCYKIITFEASNKVYDDDDGEDLRYPSSQKRKFDLRNVARPSQQ